MDLSSLLSKLGRRVVAAACQVRPNAVTNWIARGEVPAEHRLTVWQLALDAGIDWTPPGAEALRDKLRAQPVRAA
jgi:hypothetical protein